MISVAKEDLNSPFRLTKETPMKYMLMMYAEENGAPTQEQREQCYVESTAFAQKLHEAGKFLGAAPLQPTSTATSLRLQDGKRLVTDGPFAETREQLGGFFLIEAKDLDEAIEIAARIPGGRWGTVEIRPVVEIAGLPSQASEASQASEGASREGTARQRAAN